MPLTRAVRRDLTLAPAARVSGLVIDKASGRPVPHARVNLEVEFDDEGSARETESDAEGRFHIDDAGPGRYRLIARREGLVGLGGTVSLVPLQVVSGREVRLEPGVELSGLIVDGQGRGVVGARIRLWANNLVSAWPPEGTSQADGSFRLVGVVPGSYRLSVTAERTSHAGLERPLLIGPGGLTALRLVVTAVPAITGLVRGIDGTPVPGVLVRLDRNDRNGIDMPQVMTGADGRFRLSGTPADQGTVVAWDPRQGVASAAVPASSLSPSPLVLQLQTGASVVGYIRYRDGTPVPGASVAVTRQRGIVLYDSASTGEDGHFQITSLLPGTYAVRARRRGSAWNEWTSDESADLRLVTVAAGERKDVQLVVERGGKQIAGVIRLADGTPVVGATVVANAGPNARTWYPAQSGAEHRTLSGDDGRFALTDVEDERFTLWALRGDLPDAEVEGVRAGHMDVRITMRPAASISGTVRSAKGTPVSSFQVSVTPLSNATHGRGVPPKPSVRAARPPQAVHDAAGGFLVDGLPAGSYDLRVRTTTNGSARAVLTLAEGERKQGLRLTVEPSGVLTGKVVLHAQGTAVAGADVGAQVGGRWLDTRTDTEGRFELTGVFAGDQVAVDVQGPGHDLVPERKQLTVPSQVQSVDVGTLRLVAGSDWVTRRETAGNAGLQLREPDREGGPVRVRAIEPGSAAEATGIKPGDAVLAVDGQSVAGLGRRAISYLLGKPPGARLSLELRDTRGSLRTVDLVLGPRPK